jgi:predicted small secreted protein
MRHLFVKLALSTAIVSAAAFAAQAHNQMAPAGKDVASTGKIQLAQGAGGGGGSSGGSGSSGTSGSSTDSGQGGAQSPGNTNVPVGGRDPKPQPQSGQPATTTAPGTNNPSK